MTTAFWCVFIAALLPYVFVGIAKIGTGKRYDNEKPRDFLETVSGRNKRAHWAQLNSFEAFPAFAAAVIIAHIVSVEQQTIDIYAMTFIGARIAYGVCYIANWASLRSLCWMVGFACMIGLFITSGNQV